MKKVKALCFPKYLWIRKNSSFIFVIHSLSEEIGVQQTWNYYLHTAVISPCLEETGIEMPVAEASKKYEMKSLYSGTQWPLYTFPLHL